jgi:outer membrane protein
MYFYIKIFIDMMNVKTITVMLSLLIPCLGLREASGQQPDSAWSLQKCIQYATEQNIQVRKTSLNNEINRVNEQQSIQSRFPSVSGSVNQNFWWSKPLGLDNTYGNYSGENSTSIGVNSSVLLYGGGRIKNSIKQSELNYQAGQFDTETMKESISLSVMSAYLQILYAEEQVKNSRKQVESTEEQLRLADERVRLGAIAKSDYLQVKSQLATERQTLANAESLLAIDRVTLMQLMELPVKPDFTIAHPNFGNDLNQNRRPNADSIFNIALGIKPQVKSAELNKQSAELNVNIAKASYQPELTLNGGISTGYTSATSLAYDYQIRNTLKPSVGLTLSIPIYQNRQVRSKVEIAKIGTQTAGLNETDTRNQLRKAIEQASVDVSTAEKKYLASQDEYAAAQESYDVASEKFNQGLLNSVDFLIQKTNLITAESNLLQSKYNLIFSYKTLDFYSGAPLTF